MNLLFSGRAVFSRTLGPGIPQWATRIGGTDNDNAVAITSDSSGNVYVIGNYASNPLTVYNTPGTSSTIATLPLSGVFDTFVVKYDSYGTAQWATRIGGASNDNAVGITIDSSGSVYVTGGYASDPLTVYDAPGTSGTLTLPLSGIFNTFVVKYDSSGIAQWATRIGGTVGNDRGVGITSDSSGSVYVTGFYASDPLTVYNTPGTSSTIATLPISGVINTFVVKYDSYGVAEWATRIGGATFDTVNDITSDSSGIYVTGVYASNPLTVYNTPGTSSTIATLPLSGDYNTFVVKYDSSGIAQWATRIGSVGDDRGLGITSDSSGSVYVAGFYSSNPMTVYKSDGTTFGTLPSSGSYDSYIVKIMS